MPGDDGNHFTPSFGLETCRIAFQERKPDARQRAAQALARARRADNRAEAAALAKLLADNSKRQLAAEDIGPLPETIIQCRRGNHHVDTVTALAAARKLAYHQQAAALQIAGVVQSLTGSLAARGACWERGGRVDGGGGSDAMPERLARLYHKRFRPWARSMTAPPSLFQICEGCGRQHTIPARIEACRECGSRQLWRAAPHLPLVLSIVVFGAGLQQSADHFRMRRARALKLLRAGLDRYADFS